MLPDRRAAGKRVVQAADKRAVRAEPAGIPAERAVPEAADIRAGQAELQEPEQVQVPVQLQQQELLLSVQVREQGLQRVQELLPECLRAHRS